MNLIYVEDRDQIAGYAPKIWSICQEAYEPIGGFLSIAKESDIPKRAKLVKLVLSTDFDGNHEIGAVALYQPREGGFRGIGYAGNKRQVPDYRECMQLIIKDDISNFDKWFWVEASGAIAHYFKKHGGTPIPNVYASYILKRAIPENCLCDDGFNYLTQIGPLGNETTIKKMIFEFPNKDFYDKIMDAYGTLDTFSDNIKKLEAGEIKPWDLPKLEAAALLDPKITNTLPEAVKTVIWYLYNLDDVAAEHQLCEVPQDWLDRIDFSLTVLAHYPELYTNQDVENAIEIGNDLKCRLIPLTYGQTDAPPVKHVTI